MKVLVLGGGYTGQTVARLLQSQSVPVQLTNRSGSAIADFPVFPFAYSSDGPQVPLPAEALTGVTHVLSTIAPDSQGIDPVAGSLMPLLLAQNLRWFGYLSTTGVYGDTQGAWVDEESPINPQTVRSQQRASIEATFLASQLPTHIFRLPGIYGPGRSIFDRLRQGRVHHIKKPGHVFSRIHVDDIAQTLWQSMQQPAPGNIYNVSDDEPTEPSKLIREACALLQQPVPTAQPFDTVELSSMAASFWSECRRVANHKIKADLHIKLRYPTYREGLIAIYQQEHSD